MNIFSLIKHNDLEKLISYSTHQLSYTLGEDGEIPLIFALRYKRFEIFKELLKIGVDVNATDVEGRTAASWCVYYNRMDYLKILLEYQPDLNIVASNGARTLLTAIRLGYSHMIPLLLENGAKLEDNDFETYVQISGYKNIHLFEPIYDRLSPYEKELFDRYKLKSTLG